MAKFYRMNAETIKQLLQGDKTECYKCQAEIKVGDEVVSINHGTYRKNALAHGMPHLSLVGYIKND